MQLHDILLLLFAFLSEVIGTISGFGSSTFFVPLAVAIESFGFVLALTAILHCFGNFSKIYLFREHFPKKFLISLGLPSVIFAGLGALLNRHFSSERLTQFLGVVLMIIALLTLFRTKKPPRLSKKSAGILCGISGFLTGLVGTGGAIRGMTLAALQLEKNSFVALSAAIDIGGDLLRAGIYLSQGYMDWSQWFYIPLLGVSAGLGALSGRSILRRIHQKYFEKIVAVFVFMSGLAMVLGLRH